MAEISRDEGHNSMKQEESSRASTVDAHAYHQNLPPQYFDKDGVSRVTAFAARKSQAIIRIVHSIQLREELYNDVSVDQISSGVDLNMMDDDSDDSEASNDSLVRICCKS